MTPPAKIRRRQASVYALSKTLDVVVLDDGTAWFQRNHREPFILSSNERMNLERLVSDQTAEARIA